MAGYAFREFHGSHTNIVLGTTHDRAFKVVDNITLSNHLLTGGRVVLHNQGRGFSIFIINDEFDLTFIIRWLHMLRDDVS